MGLKRSSKAQQILVWFIVYSFFISFLGSAVRAGEGAWGFTARWLAFLESQRNDPRPRPGPPEGEFPNLNEIRRRPQLDPHATEHVPSTIRSRRIPLVPWDGRRVGDPLPPNSQGASSLAPNPGERGMASSPNNQKELNGRVGISARDGRKSRASHHAQPSLATTGLLAPPLPDDQYVQNFFYWALLRYPNSTEAIYWNDIFRAAYANGHGSLVMATRELGKTLFESSEYAARNRDNHWYVFDLYKTVLMRDPDAGGWAYWESVIPNSGRENVRRAFEDCTELSNLLATITPNGPISSAVSSLLTARIDPTNQPGNGMLARDANWSVPLLSLPGRSGLDLGLVLSYSSMIWTRSGPYIYFDEDNDFPSPGFRLGFPAVQRRLFDAQVGKNAYLLITSAGRRVELRQLGASNIYEATDSSYLQLIDNGSSLLARSTDGTQLNYVEFNNEYRCTQIKDRNGNYLTVNYNGLGQITTVTDTLARVVTFNYDGNANLLSISQSWNGQTHNWATFGWGTRAMQSSFSGVAVVGAPNGTVVPVITQVGLHDGSYFTFDYTNALQASIARRYTSDQVQRSSTAFDYDSPVSECPRLMATRASAHNWTGLNGVPTEVVTQYGVEGGVCVMTAPDGTIYKEFYGTGWQKGLTTLSETWSDGIRQKWTTTAWARDNTSSVNDPLNPRPIEINVNDAANNRRRTTIEYHPSFGLPSVVTEYAADPATVLRRTYFDYKSDLVYIERRIIGLLFRRTVYDANSNLMSKTEYGYDWDWSGDMFQDTPAPATQHDRANYGPSFIVGRGNLSQVARFDVTDPNNANNTWQETKWRVNSTGSVLMERDHQWHQIFISYGDSFSDGNNSRNTFAYPTTITDAGGFSSYVQYNFDFGEKTRVQGPPPAGQSQGLIQTFSYDNAVRLSQTTTVNNGAYTRHVYGPNYIQSYATVNNVTDEAYSVQMFDGVGRVTAAATNHPGSTGGYSAVHSTYDAMGWLMKRSNPTEVLWDWSPFGDDAAGWLYTQQTYDWQGRPRITTNPDGTTKEASYGGCGCAGGAVVTLTDEGTLAGGAPKRRQQKIYSDVLGRTVKTEVLNWQGGTVYSATVNTYNARDQVTLVRQFQENAPSDPNDLSCPSGTCQQTVMTYDGHGRLKTRHVPEQNAGTATTWEYNSDDTVQKVTDARGATTTFDYNSRHLVTGVAYGVPAGSGIPVPATVNFGYDAAGNRTSMTDGSGSVSYGYDQLSRLSSETRSFSGVSGSYGLSYQYNLANELTLLSIPFTSQQTGYQYDTAGRLLGTTATGFSASYYNSQTQQTFTLHLSSFVSNIAYRAWGARKSMNYGNSTSETIGYNSRQQPSNYTINNVIYQNQNICCAYPTFTTMSWTYEYYADGRLHHAWDFTNDWFDRSYAYDHAGRMSEASTYRRARGLSPFPAVQYTDPYHQLISYDVWGNSNRNGKLYVAERSDSGTYNNNRRSGWSYDADGNVTNDWSYQHAFDAAGLSRQATSLAMVGDGTMQFPFQPAVEITQTYDGIGQSSKRVQHMRQNIYDEFNEEHPLIQVLEDIQQSYYLRSSVLGGAEVMELAPDAQGGALKKVLHIYAGGQRIATEEWGSVTFEHHSPATGSWVITHGHSDLRATGRQERDPGGAELPLSNPYPGVNYVSMKWEQPLFIEGSDPFDYVSGYSLDGMPMSRSQLNRTLGELGPSGMMLFDVFKVDNELRNYPELWWQYYSGTVGIALPSAPNQRKNDKPQRPPTVKNATPTQQGRFDGAFNELWKRLHANDGKNPCAEAFGGIKNADEALWKTKFSFDVNLRADVNARTAGREIRLSPRADRALMTPYETTYTFYLVTVTGTGKTPGGYDVTNFSTSSLTLDSVTAGAFLLAHELGHRRKIYGKLENDDNFVSSGINNKKIWEACFKDIVPVPVLGPLRPYT